MQDAHFTTMPVRVSIRSLGGSTAFIKEYIILPSTIQELEIVRSIYTPMDACKAMNLQTGTVVWLLIQISLWAQHKRIMAMQTQEHFVRTSTQKGTHSQRL